MDETGAIVIGAGAVGLAVARALAQAGHETLVLEAEAGIGQGVSSRNSEVIHAGLYYAAGSLKAELCVRGKALLYDFCASHGVPHAACGKLIVATAEDQQASLQALQAKAQATGVPLHAWTAQRAIDLEPELSCTAALWSPSTGIIDSHAYMLALQGDLERAGGVVALHAAVRHIERDAGGGYVVDVGSAAGDDAFRLRAPLLVNAAGLNACHLAAGLAALDRHHVPQPRYAKGNYFTVAGRPPFRHLVYPAPVDAWLGVHVTIDLAGQVKFGPDLQWLPDGDAVDLDYAVDASRAAAFEDAVRRYWPRLPTGALQPAYSGIRPKIHGPDEPAPDFRIDGPARHGLSGLVNLLGIESPGLTSSLAIAERVVGLLSTGP